MTPLTPLQKKLKKRLTYLMSEISTTPEDNVRRFLLLKHKLEKTVEAYKKTL